VVTARANALAPLLCYACHTTLTSRSVRGAAPTKPDAPPPPSPVVRLPVWASVAMFNDQEPGEAMDVRETHRMDAREMNEAVGGFLLEPE
jgi:cytoplasmic tRNA 2-thiolation protein 2